METAQAALWVVVMLVALAIACPLVLVTRAPARSPSSRAALIAAAILASSLAHHGELPILSWLAPGILGAFAFSIQYVAVFAKYCPTRHDPVENWGERTAGLILIIQVAGLILMWA